jgi:hypothetical protein
VAFPLPVSDLRKQLQSEIPLLTLLPSIEWHVDQGLIATMIEAPLEIQKSQVIPQNHIEACQAANIPFAGNAAANTVDHFDLKGANIAPKPLPAGFTPRGIVAMVFSCIAALLGLATITWYVLLPHQPEIATLMRSIGTV